MREPGAHVGGRATASGEKGGVPTRSAPLGQRVGRAGASGRCRLGATWASLAKHGRSPHVSAGAPFGVAAIGADVRGTGLGPQCSGHVHTRHRTDSVNDLDGADVLEPGVFSGGSPSERSA